MCFRVFGTHRESRNQGNWHQRSFCFTESIGRIPCFGHITIYEPQHFRLIRPMVCDTFYLHSLSHLPLITTLFQNVTTYNRFLLSRRQWHTSQIDHSLLTTLTYLRRLHIGSLCFDGSWSLWPVGTYCLQVSRYKVSTTFTVEDLRTSREENIQLIGNPSSLFVKSLSK